MERNFFDLLGAKWQQDKFLCVGLDPDYNKIPTAIKIREDELGFPQIGTFTSFLCPIIDATKDIVCAYKPNIAFFEPHGTIGLEALEKIIGYIHRVAPDVPVILDAKRADIGNTNKGYAEAAFDKLKADAITVHPYLGSEAMQPFLSRQEKGVIVLCRTSNPGAGEFQDLQVMVTQTRTKPLFEMVAETVRDKWNKNGNCMVVVGATYPDELKIVRDIVGDMPILIPGVGTQGGDVAKVLRAGLNQDYEGIIINSSSGIIFNENPGEAAQELHSEIVMEREKFKDEKRLVDTN